MRDREVEKEKQRKNEWIWIHCVERRKRHTWNQAWEKSMGARCLPLPALGAWLPHTQKTGEVQVSEEVITCLWFARTDFPVGSIYVDFVGSGGCSPRTRDNHHGEITSYRFNFSIELLPFCKQTLFRNFISSALFKNSLLHSPITHYSPWLVDSRSAHFRDLISGCNLNREVQSSLSRM